MTEPENEPEEMGEVPLSFVSSCNLSPDIRTWKPGVYEGDGGGRRFVPDSISQTGKWILTGAAPGFTHAAGEGRRSNTERRAEERRKTSTTILRRCGHETTTGAEEEAAEAWAQGERAETMTEEGEGGR